MCGLVGLLEAETCERAALLRAMNERIVHRGPDEQGVYEDGFMAMGMRRLSIQDVAHGHQPSRSEDGTVVAMLNGEIYNVVELRRMLIGRGHRLASDGDTELVPHLYEEFGVDFVHHLRGMFAIAVWDLPRRRLVLVRDRLGKKPLYYRSHPGGLAYASELKSVLVDPRVERRPDLVAINHYLTYQYVPAPWAAVEGVQKLPPGHLLVVEGGQPRVRRYWNLQYAPAGTDSPQTDDELAEILRERLIESVRLRMIGERPVGAFLSGGLDSSSVVAAMRRAGVSDIRTFSIGFENEKFNELPHARRVAERYETEHHELVVNPDVADLLPKLSRMFDEPYSDSSAIPSWYLAEMTRREVVVALNGDGGDEALGGYQRYAITLRAPQSVIPRQVAALMRRTGSALRRYGSMAGPVDKLSKATLVFGETTPARRYARFVSYFREEEKLAIAATHFASLVREHDSYGIIENLWHEHRDTDALNRLLAVDTHSYLPGDLNAKVDITTMSVSLEARSPFLDHTFVEWAASIPGHRKIKNGSMKHLLKVALRGWLSEDLIHRTKMGFGIPLAEWLRGPLRDLTYDCLTDRTARERGLFDAGAVRQLVDEHMRGVDRAAHVYTLLMLELWFREVLESSV